MRSVPPPSPCRSGGKGAGGLGGFLRTPNADPTPDILTHRTDCTYSSGEGVGHRREPVRTACRIRFEAFIAGTEPARGGRDKELRDEALPDLVRRRLDELPYRRGLGRRGRCLPQGRPGSQRRRRLDLRRRPANPKRQRHRHRRHHHRRPQPETKAVIGGFSIIEVPSHADALEWATKIAVACRCTQEVRELMYDPES